MVEQSKIRTMPLQVKLSEGELSLRAQELASAERVLGEAEAALAESIESAKGAKTKGQNEVSDARGEVRRLAAVVRERSELRDVPVAEDYDFTAGAVNTYRTDTSEIVATRGMTPEERQRSLFGDTTKKQSS
jgi:hypothetical protein